VKTRRHPQVAASSKHLDEGRRKFLESLAFAATGALTLDSMPARVSASGGATAGKYTTIPIAKRRYFGRVKQGIYEYLAMGAAVKAGNFQSPAIENFFSQTIVNTKGGKRRTNCIGGDKECSTTEKTASRWEDLQLAMFLLGNAFRLDSGKPPEKVRQVKEAKAFFKEVEEARVAMNKGNTAKASTSYQKAIDALEIYLNEVELPPTDDATYAKKTDTTVESLCQGSYCI
jgi:hypothetical protein